MTILKYLLGLILVISLLASCTKEPAVVDYDTGHLPVDYDVDTTINLTAYTIRQDSLDTFKKLYGILGSFNDPVFGKTSAGFFTQMIPKDKAEYDAGSIADSLILTFAISGIYGNKYASHEISIFQLTGALIDTIRYMTRIQGKETDRDTIPYESKPLFKGIYKISGDSIIVDGKKQPAQIRINLSKTAPEFVQFLLDGSDKMGSATSFMEYFRGFYVTVSPTPDLGSDDGNFAQINFLSEVSGMRMYYHTPDKAGLSKQYVIDKDCRRWMRYKHYDYAQADQLFKQQVLNGDTLLGKERLYIQSLLGVKVKIALPDLSSLTSKGKIIINEARLVMNNIGEESKETVPKIIMVRGVNTKGALVPLVDEFEFGGDKYYYNGMYTASKKQYFIRISRFINQKLYNLGDVDKVRYLELFSYNDILSTEIKPEAERLILAGTDPMFNEKHKRLSIRILYSFAPEIQ